MTEDSKENFSSLAERSHRYAMNTAVRILTRRDHSEYELKRKLQQRGFAADVIDTVIVTCDRLGYIDDHRTARVYILELKRRCFGKRYIRQALKKKRLSGAAIEKLLLEVYPGAAEHDTAARLLAKKMKTFKREADFRKRNKKIYRFLYSRGFSSDTITDLLRDAGKPSNG